MNETSHPAKRFLYLDSARGLAALSVVVWHFIAAFTKTKNNSFFLESPAHFLWYGEADVVFFFIHSGFILTYAYANRQSKLTPANYLRFLIERVFRIYPLFLFLLVISFALQKNVYPLEKWNYISEKFYSFWQGDFSLRKVFKNAALVFSTGQQSNSLIPQDWTLGIEVIVGPCVPLLAFFLKKYKRQWLYWVIILVLILLVKVNTYLFEFAMGVFLFYNWVRINDLWKMLGKFGRLMILVVSIILYTCLFHFCSLFDLTNVLFRPGIDRFMVAMGCSLFFCTIISSRIIQKIMSFPLLVKIGKACYSLYLWHMIFLICFADFFMQWLNRIMPMTEQGLLIIFFIVYITLNLFLSQLTYRFIEIPFNLLGKRIGRNAEMILNHLT